MCEWCTKLASTFGDRLLDLQRACFIVRKSQATLTAGAYIGLLQQLKTILEPDDKWQPTPAAPLPQPVNLKAKDEWIDRKIAIRWQHSCFPELTTKWRPYDRLLAGKYADRVQTHLEHLQAGSQCSMDICLRLRCFSSASRDVYVHSNGSWDTTLQASCDQVVGIVIIITCINNDCGDS